MKGAVAVLLAVIKWPLFGALLAGGALVVANYAGPDVAKDLGGEAGAGFAEGMAKMQKLLSSGELRYGRARACARY